MLFSFGLRRLHFRGYRQDSELSESFVVSVVSFSLTGGAGVEQWDGVIPQEEGRWAHEVLG